MGWPEDSLILILNPDTKVVYRHFSQDSFTFYQQLCHWICSADKTPLGFVTQDVARTRQGGQANILICFSSPRHPSSVECFSDMNPFKVLKMSVKGEQSSTQASIISSLICMGVSIRDRL